MSAVIIGIITFVCVMGGMITGMLLRKNLPDHHLSGDSKDAVKMGSGLIATLSALVLGLLISSAKTSFDEMSNAITESSAKLIVLDRVLAQYGPETQEIRSQLRESIAKWINVVWPQAVSAVDGMNIFEKSPATLELVANKLRALEPQNDYQRASQSDAIQICSQLLQTRWLVIEQAQISLPTVFIVVQMFWLTILFGTIGLFAPPNKTVIAALIVCAMSVSGAMFLIEEMNKPLSGIVKISSAPLVKAIEHMGK
jgi:hypothetical protein